MCKTYFRAIGRNIFDRLESLDPATGYSIPYRIPVPPVYRVKNRPKKFGSGSVTVGLDIKKTTGITIKR